MLSTSHIDQQEHEYLCSASFPAKTILCHEKQLQQYAQWICWMPVLSKGRYFRQRENNYKFHDVYRKLWHWLKYKSLWVVKYIGFQCLTDETIKHTQVIITCVLIYMKTLNLCTNVSFKVSGKYTRTNAVGVVAWPSPDIHTCIIVGDSVR